MNCVPSKNAVAAPAPFMLSKPSKRTGEGKIDGQKKKGLPIRFSPNPFNSRDAFRRQKRFPKKNTTKQAERKMASQV